VAGEHLTSERLELVALDAEDLDAWIARDHEVLNARTGARFQPPSDAPPLFDEDLSVIRGLLAESPVSTNWTWLLVQRTTSEPVGIAGFSAVDGEEGVMTTGYSVFPHFERQGYVTEALARLVAWLGGLRGVRLLRATIPEWNPASIRVATKLGMRPVGTTVDHDVGPVTVYEMPVSARPTR
jgi:RimJ/RimL family protein N-acetyltransferase